MEAISALVSLLIMVAFFWLLSRAGLSIDRDWYLVQYSKTARVMSIVGAIMSLLIVYSALSAEPGPRIEVLWVLYAIVGFALLGVNETFRRKVWFDGEAIHYQSPYGKRLTLPVSDISACENWGNVFRIRSRRGEKIDFPALMSGSGEFCSLVREYLISKKAEQAPKSLVPDNLIGQDAEQAQNSLDREYLICKNSEPPPRTEFENCQGWQDFLAHWFGEEMERTLLDDPGGAPSWIWVMLNGLEFCIVYAKDPDVLTLWVSSPSLANSSIGLADDFDFDEESAKYLDNDLREVLSNGWKEQHYYFLSSEPWMRKTWIGGERSTTYTAGCLIPLANVALLGLPALLSKKLVIHCEPTRA